MNEQDPWLENTDEQRVYRTHLRLHGKICSVATARRNVDRLRSGSSVELVEELIRSEFVKPETQSNSSATLLLRTMMDRNPDGFVALAYSIVLSRAPDIPGFRFYEARILAGHAPAEILLELLNSQEARIIGRSDESKARLFGQLAEQCAAVVGNVGDVPAANIIWNSLIPSRSENFLKLSYQWALGRTPDPSGLDFYRRELARGRSRISVLIALASSAESLARLRSGRGKRIFRFLKVFRGS